MGSRITVMFAANLDTGSYMVGEKDGAGKIVDFSEVILSRAQELNRDDAFYLVVLDDDFRDVSVAPFQIYKAYFKTHQRPVAEAMRDGSIDGLTIANDILLSFHKKSNARH